MTIKVGVVVVVGVVPEDDNAIELVTIKEVVVEVVLVILFEDIAIELVTSNQSNSAGKIQSCVVQNVGMTTNTFLLVGQ